jgi:hypothetical protein
LHLLLLCVLWLLLLSAPAAGLPGWLGLCLRTPWGVAQAWGLQQQQQQVQQVPQPPQHVAGWLQLAPVGMQVPGLLL